MKQTEMKTFDVVTRELSTSYEEAFHYISDPKNLPEWTLYIKQANENSCVIEKPHEGGKVSYKLVTDASIGSGVIDWSLIAVDGQVRHSKTRLVWLEKRKCLYNFVFFYGDVEAEDDAETLRRQKAFYQQMVGELEKLQEILAK